MRSRRPRHTCLLAFIILGFHPGTHAQQDWAPPPPPGAQTLATEEDVVQTIRTASQELMLATPFLYSSQVADALRVAMVERGVTVYILAPTVGIEDQGSYLLGLALAGAALSVAPVEDAFAVVDRTVLVLGPLLVGKTPLPGQSVAQTFYFNDAAKAGPYVSSFYESYSLAEPYDSEAFVNQIKDAYLREETP